MVLTEIIEFVLERGFGFIGAHGFEAGMLATALVILYHSHSILSFIQTAIKTVRIGFIGAALVLGALVIGISMGWLTVGQLPSISALPFVVELVG